MSDIRITSGQSARSAKAQQAKPPAKVKVSTKLIKETAVCLERIMEYITSKKPRFLNGGALTAKKSEGVANREEFYKYFYEALKNDTSAEGEFLSRNNQVYQ